MRSKRNGDGCDDIQSCDPQVLAGAAPFFQVKPSNAEASLYKRQQIP